MPTNRSESVTIRKVVVGNSGSKSFALIYASSLARKTFLHLNREGDHWKLRWFRSPSGPATQVAQSAKKSTRLELDLRRIEFVHEIAYPHSTSPYGVPVTNSHYWFHEIAKLNAAYDIRWPIGQANGEIG